MEEAKPTTEVTQELLQQFCKSLTKSKSTVSKKNGFGDSKEVGRVRITDTTELILSRGTKGWSISKWVVSETYTGWGKGAVWIPDEFLTDFLKLFGVDELKFALDDFEVDIDKQCNKDMEVYKEEVMTEQGDT